MSTNISFRKGVKQHRCKLEITAPTTLHDELRTHKPKAAMAFGEPHTHTIHFRECGHTDPRYVFLPDPKNAARCVCSRTDEFKISLSFSGEVNYTQQRREIPAKCDDCSLRPKMTIEEYTAYLAHVPEDENTMDIDRDSKPLSGSPSKRQRFG
ncbi:hypothetical protein EYR41_012010 [Orbilia oligospora]|uniref:Uncharacterized protein n=1 Tax=Orbilia oligospora TaxID=2813651 RepID=A0A8H2DRV3_ORBOL|nr:hypothetical protein EYR41_012010 [Orbilia oligospora]